jgi:hypothetical protein
MKRIDGAPVANGMTRLRVNVTKQDIENGEPMNPDACAIARACVRQVKNVVAAKVHKGRLYLKFEGQARWRRWFVPEYATREIVAFDRGGRFVPQQIDFVPPPAYVLPRYRKPKEQPTRRRSDKGVRAIKRLVHRTLDVRDDAHKNEPAEG